MATENEARKVVLSLVTPAYNEAPNLPALYAEIVKVLDPMAVDWEWVIVDDHSADATFQTVIDLSHRDARVRGVRFARNSGSHTAVACGLDFTSGECAVILAADLQDPPSAVPLLLEKWHEGFQVVWAARGQREGQQAATIASARAYYWVMRRIVGMAQMPAEGADFFLMDRRVVEAFRRFRESNVSILALISWMGFRQCSITYTKHERLHGQSGWTLTKKLKLLVDSVTSFSYVPIRLMSYLGLTTAALGFIYATVILMNAILGKPVAGWTSIMMVLLIIGGIQMVMMGILGEYVWRALDESRRRPRYLVEDVTGLPEGGVSEDVAGKERP
jgi:polyisoprenyl-phosphate glycosyltransferase